MPDQDQKLFDLVGSMVDAGKDDDEIRAAIKEYRGAQPKAPAAPEPQKRSLTTRVASTLPMVGGAIGDVYGPGWAAVGGAAGQGYKQLLEHGTELPGAALDVARNMFSEPVATIKGMHQGIAEGGIAASKEAAKQAAISLGGRAVIRGLQPVKNFFTNPMAQKALATVAKNKDVVPLTMAAANIDNPKGLEKAALLRLLMEPRAWAAGGAALAKAPVANMIRGGSIINNLTRDYDEQ